MAHQRVERTASAWRAQVESRLKRLTELCGLCPRAAPFDQCSRRPEHRRGTRARCLDRGKLDEMDHEYIEFPEGDHGNVITDGMPGIFEFFKANPR